MKISFEIDFDNLSAECKKDISYIMEHFRDSTQGVITDLFNYGSVVYLAFQAKRVVKQLQDKKARAKAK